jgi:hypothetical protein
MPREGGGRVVFMIQCKSWIQNVDSEKHVVAKARWGRQHVLCDAFYATRTAKDDQSNPKPNLFKQRFDAKDKPLKPKPNLLKQKDTRLKPILNQFKKRFDARSRAMYPDGGYPTDFVFVLASVNDVTEAEFRASGPFEALRTTDPASKTPALLHDELLLDLKVMEHWCPTVAFGMHASVKLWSVVRESTSGTDGNGPQP